MLRFLGNLTDLIATYGYLAVFLFVGIESLGIPLPGETMLVTAAIYAGTTHRLQIAFVIIAAIAGAIIGDNIGYLIGRTGGYALLRRFGRYIRLEDRRLKLGQYLFKLHGGKVVFFGRFVAVLRTWAAFLAGVNLMHWRRFLLFNAAGGIAWATLFGTGAYLLGNAITRFSGPLDYGLLGLAIVGFVAFLLFIRRNEARLADEAERAMPGPLDGYRQTGS